VQAVRDEPTVAVVRALKHRRAGGDQLLAYHVGRSWHPVRSDQISERLKQLIGDQYSVKDFRTWNATVLAAVSLAADGRDAVTTRARKRAMDGAVRGVAKVLGNTPTVARNSYIDPRVFDRYLSGWTIGVSSTGSAHCAGPTIAVVPVLSTPYLTCSTTTTSRPPCNGTPPARPDTRTASTSGLPRRVVRAVLEPLRSATEGRSALWRPRP
jgi:hypothetical protein